MSRPVDRNVISGYWNALGDRLRAGLTDLFIDKRIAARAVGIGSLFGIHLINEDVTSYRRLARTDKVMAHRVFLALLEQGYFLSHTLFMNALSLPMDTSHVDGLIEAVGQAVDDVGL